jgi:hypothetical protein
MEYDLSQADCGSIYIGGLDSNSVKSSFLIA